jgi:voltage-gated potassium channel
MEFSKINPDDTAKGLNSSHSLDLQMKNQEEATKIDKLEFIRLKLKKLVNNSIPGFLYTNIMLALSIFSCLEFIVETYIYDKELNQHLEKLEVFMAAIFSFDWILNFFIADHKLLFISSFFSMVDVLTVLPIYFTYGKSAPLLNELVNLDDYVLYLMFFFSTTRILRGLRLHRKLMYVSDAVSRCLFDITLTLTVMILFNSAVMQYLDVTEQPLQFHDWMYFIIVTISTVGFGDISPKTTLGI